MPISLLTGPANAGKARIVLDDVRARARRGEEPLLVVPTGADVEHYRRELAEAGLVLGVRVERFAGLMAEVVRRAGGARERTLSPLARERVLAAAIAEVHPSAAFAAGPGFVRALASFCATLQAQRVAPARLRRALHAWAHDGPPGRGERARELAELFEAYRRLLRTISRVDPERQAARALDALRESPALWGGTPVLLYGFDDLTPPQLDAVETLGRVVDAPLTVSLTFEPGRLAFGGRAGTFQTLLPWAAEHRHLPARPQYYAPAARTALHHLERELFELGGERVAPGGAVRLLEGGSPRAELELIAGEIRALLERGVPAEEIAIVHRSPETVAELLAEVLRDFEVPFAFARRLPFRDTEVGRALCGLLRVACDGSGGLAAGSLEDLLAWLRAPGLLPDSTARGDGRDLADRMEARARRAGIESAAQARALWESEHWPLQALDQIQAAAALAADGRPAALVERIARELEWLFAAPARGTARVLAGEELEQARALMLGRRALTELAELARSAPQLAPGPAELVGILEGLHLPRGEPPGAGAVAVLDPLALRARRVRALFLCGLQEGTFPAPGRPEPLLSEDERRELAQASGLVLAGAAGEQSLAVERYLLYASLSRPQELLALSWHTAAEDGETTVPSLFLEDVCDLFSAQLRATCVRRPLGAASWPGPGPPAALRAQREPVLGGARRAPPGIAPLRDPQLLAALREQRLWSASSLEVWAGCPVRWLVERLLRTRGLDPDPEPLARGGLAHAALRDTLAGLREQSGSARLTPASLGLARTLLHEALTRHADSFPLSVAPERVPGVRRRLEADLERYLEHAAAAESPLEPAHLELSFGFDEDELAALDLGGGVRLRGRIDRVDLSAAGDAVLYDYKGAQAPPADRWVAQRSLQIALYMRAVEQLLGRRALGGFYQPLAGRDLRARGALAADGGVALECVRGDVREREDLDALVGDAVQLAREAAAQADRGELQARPDTCAFGDGGCMYPTICRCER
ncbi:MAG TPA: PD-(D/E)XK nuclease family protein [Solirubrobacteraceae bacterium]